MDARFRTVNAFDEAFLTNTGPSLVPAFANLLGFFAFLSFPIVLLKEIFGPSSYGSSSSEPVSFRTPTPNDDFFPNGFFTTGGFLESPVK